MVRFLAITNAIAGVGAVAFFLLWIGAKGDVIEEREACNQASIQAALDAERLAHAATRRNYETTVADLVGIAERERESRAIAEAAERAAIAGVALREAMIDELVIEVEKHEIPDSTACLDVFVPERSISGLRLQNRGLCGRW